MIRQTDLISYLPQFIQEYREIKQIMIGETPEIQILEDETEIIKNNQFILTCDDVGIRRFEILLGITPSPDDTLDARISRVITRWNDSLPYTYKSLIDKLNIMCGEGNYEIIPDFKNYTMEIKVSLPLSGQVDEFEYLMSYMIPANIIVITNNIIQREIGSKIFAASTVITEINTTINTTINSHERR